MEVLHPRCAGLDVHKDTVVACARLAHESRVERHTETFATTTRGLMALSEWLTGHQVTPVALEATGVYWKPVWHLLDGHFDLTLANPHHIRTVPGRKTDVRDAQWIADLHAHGLVGVGGGAHERDVSARSSTGCWRGVAPRKRSWRWRPRS